MKIAIIGAGISGLSLGSWLVKNHFPKKQISIFEASADCGGVIDTSLEKDYLVESAAAFFTNKKLSIHRLCLFLGLDKDIILSTPETNLRYIYYNNRLNKIGANLLNFFLFSLNTRDKIYLFKNLLKLQKKKPKKDESIKEFFIRQVGLNFFCNLIDPVISGIYAGDLSQLSIKACFPEFIKYEKFYGSLLRGLRKKKSQPGVLSLKHGMKHLTESMFKYLGDRIEVEMKLKEIILPQKKSNQSLDREKTICVFQDGKSLAFDRVILSIPAYSAAQVLKKTPIAKKLKKISYVPLVVCALGFEKNAIPKSLKGFGLLVPAHISKDFLGAHFPCNIFPDYRCNKESFLVQAYAGGYRNPDLISWEDKKILKSVTHSLSRFANIDKPFNYSKIIRYEKAIPQYQMEHLSILKAIENFSEQYPLHFHNNSYYGVGISDCVENSEKLSLKLVKLLK